MGFLGAEEAEILLLGFLVLLVGLLHKSEAFERLVGSRIKGPMNLAYATFGLPLTLLLLRTPRSRGSGIFRILGGLVLVVVLVIIVVLALVAFLIYRFLRRRR